LIIDIAKDKSGSEIKFKELNEANEVLSDPDIDGETNIDESMVTGESIPVAKSSGDKLIGATVNGTGSMLMRAEKVGSDTLLAQIVDMVAKAQRTRAPIQKLTDVVAGYFVPAVVVCAVLTFIAWWVWGLIYSREHQC
jgi:Cu+-exporting ATPase